MDLQEVGWGASTGLIWLRMGTSGGYFGFHKTWGIPWLAKNRLSAE
jgi:hypothetical protein